jgi:hypothetical protein
MWRLLLATALLGLARAQGQGGASCDAALLDGCRGTLIPYEQYTATFPVSRQMRALREGALWSADMPVDFGIMHMISDSRLP